jgi:hypothetical protein
MVRNLQTAEYYREHAKQLLELAEETVEPERAMALRHIASNFEVIANLIDVMNASKH